MNDGKIEIVGWENFQHYKGNDRPAWIKFYTRLLHDDAYLDLTFHQRGILHGLWLEYAMAGRQLRDTTATLSRRLGHRVLTRDLEALRDAGFIVIHSRASLELSRVDKSREEKKREEPPSGGSNGHRRDEVWDTLEAIFGTVPPKTNAHGKRNKACADLKRFDATVDTIRRAHQQWSSVYPGATCTDTALATHYAQLVTQAPASKVCPHCGPLPASVRLADHLSNVHDERMPA